MSLTSDLWRERAEQAESQLVERDHEIAWRGIEQEAQRVAARVATEKLAGREKEIKRLQDDLACCERLKDQACEAWAAAERELKACQFSDAERQAALKVFADWLYKHRDPGDDQQWLKDRNADIESARAKLEQGQ